MSCLKSTRTPRIIGKKQKWFWIFERHTFPKVPTLAVLQLNTQLGNYGRTDAVSEGQCTNFWLWIRAASSFSLKNIPVWLLTTSCHSMSSLLDIWGSSAWWKRHGFPFSLVIAFVNPFDPFVLRTKNITRKPSRSLAEGDSHPLGDINGWHMDDGTEARIYDEPSGNWDTGTEKIGMTWKSWNWQSYRVPLCTHCFPFSWYPPVRRTWVNFAH